MNVHHCLSYLSVLFLMYAVSACEVNSNPEMVTPRYFEFVHQGGETNYTFVAKTTDSEVSAKAEEELSKPLDERNLHIHGNIARGNKDYNGSWNWHFVPGEWDLVEVSTEVCDGTPQMVENDREYWVDEVGNFCPWSSRVSGEVEGNSEE